jgi:hypothetical protein
VLVVAGCRSGVYWTFEGFKCLEAPPWVDGSDSEGFGILN